MVPSNHAEARHGQCLGAVAFGDDQRAVLGAKALDPIDAQALETLSSPPPRSGKGRHKRLDTRYALRLSVLKDVDDQLSSMLFLYVFISALCAQRLFVGLVGILELWHAKPETAIAEQYEDCIQEWRQISQTSTKIDFRTGRKHGHHLTRDPKSLELQTLTRRHVAGASEGQDRSCSWAQTLDASVF